MKNHSESKNALSSLLGGLILVLILGGTLIHIGKPAPAATAHAP